MRWRRLGWLSLAVAAVLLTGMLTAGGPAALACQARLHRVLDWPAIARICFARQEPLPVGDAELEAQIAVRDLDGLLRTREQLVSYLWERPDLPLDRLPSSVQAGIHDSLFADMDNLEEIDLIEIALEYGFVARAYHFLPRRANGMLMIYHAGHEASFRGAREVFDAFLDEGFAILALDMPMRGINLWPERIYLPGGGTVSLADGSHWALSFLESERFSPLRLFIEPLLRAVNHVNAHFDYRRMVMLGISGGGWTTTVYAALDPRIARSYPVAGTLPFDLRRSHPLSGRHASEGDWEQRVPGFYRLASYLDLYVMGAAGPWRRQLQVLNRYDPCCFFGDDALRYEPMVGRALQDVGIGGSFQVLIDDSHASHAISPAALARIIEDALDDDAEEQAAMAL